MLRVEKLRAGYNFKVLDGVSFSISRGELLGLLGPNGSGKTTLLKCIWRALKPWGGVVVINSLDIASFSQRELAKLVAVVPQSSGLDPELRVFEAVAMGRYPHAEGFSRSLGKVEHVLKELGLEVLSSRRIRELSGGERQKVLVARSLAQEAEVLLLDEPTAHLDLRHQLEVMSLIKELISTCGLVGLVAMHDINLAARFCDKLVLLKDGKVLAAGKPLEVLTPKNLEQTYGVSTRLELLAGKPLVVISERRREKDLRIHVIPGAGAATPLLRDLFEHGFQLSTGVVSLGDADELTARLLGVARVVTKPFGEITREEYKENLGLISASDLVVLPPIPFGWGNLRNLEACLEAAKLGKELLVVERNSFHERDFTNGAATHLYNEVLRKALVFNEERELLHYVLKA